MVTYNECIDCYDKTTTTGCFKCDIFKIKSAIQELYDFIESHKSNLSQYIFFINDKYYKQIESSLNFNLSVVDITISKRLEDNQICVVVDKKELDWGDFYI